MTGLKTPPLPPALLRFRNVVLASQFLLTAALILSVCFIAVSSPDFWWQLSEGHKILAAGHINNIQPEAFGLLSSPYVNEYVLYDLLIAIAHKMIGMGGLRVLFGILNFLPFALVIAIWFRYRGRCTFIYLLAGAATFGLLGLRLRQRPEILGTDLSVLLGLILLGDQSAQMTRARCLIIAFILCLWSNLHSSFIVGLGMLGLWQLETLWRHRLDKKFRTRFYSFLFMLTIAVFAVALNPNGLERLWTPFSLQSNFWSMAVTSEMWPIESQWYWIMASVLALGVYLWSSVHRQSHPLWLLVCFFVTALMALVSWRHINVMGCSLLVLLAFRIKSDAEVSRPNIGAPVALACQIVVSAGMAVVMAYFLFQRVSHEAEDWKQDKPATINRLYSANAILELHYREPKGTSFLAEMFDSSFAEGTPQYKLRPLIDTGLSRYSNETVRFYFYLDNQPPALRLALNLLNTNYVIVNSRNAHWATVLNDMPAWSLSFVSEHGLIYQRHAIQTNRTNMKETLKIVARKTEERDRNAAGAYYTMGLLTPDTTLGLLAGTARLWWKEPSINFVLDWLNRVPLTSLQQSMVRLSLPNNPSQLRLRILLALRLGLIHEAEYLSQSSNLSRYDLEDAVLRAEVLLSTKQPCAARGALRFIFPMRSWSVRLAEVVNRIKQVCKVDPTERFVSTNIQELVWSKDLEPWIREMADKLNQRILVSGTLG